MARDLWTRDEMILVLNLYLKLPFGKMDSRNPEELTGSVPVSSQEFETHELSKYKLRYEYN